MLAWKKLLMGTFLAGSGVIAGGFGCGGEEDVSSAAGSSSRGTDASSSGTGGAGGMGGTGGGSAASCAELLQQAPGSASGIYTIDPDGHGPIEPFKVHCDMSSDGGGWTLVMVSSDDGVDTWTWVKRALMSTDTALVGSVSELNKDFKSLAHHVLPFSDLLFVHAPSGVWAAYGGVSDGSKSIADFMAAIPFPVCDASLPDNGFPQTAGTLTKAGKLCDTDLYFHLGDVDGQDVNYCKNLDESFNNATFGPAWNMGQNNGCPFDDPAQSSFGPFNKCSDPQCNGNNMIEGIHKGFGHPLGLNTGAAGAAENYIWMLVR